MPAIAQTPPPQASDTEIVVRGGLEEKKSDWKRAESDHVIVYSDGSEAELVRVTNNLERLHQLMSRLYRKGNTADDTAKLQVTLFGSADYFRRMGLRNLRWDEGPYAASFSGQRYYDPREDGEVLAVARSDQTIKLNTKKAFDEDCEERMADGASCENPPYHFPAMRSWEAVLYSSFAQRFLLTYTQASYPRWYIDGIGALFSTLEVRKDGAIDYALAPVAYKEVFRSYGRVSVEDVLTGAYLTPTPGRPRRMDWTPYHAWLLAHYFSYSNLPPERARQFRAYMTAIHRGAPMAGAARVFGDMGRLQREIAAYAERPISFARTAPAQPFGGNPLVSTLSMSSAAVIEARIELGVPGSDAERTAWLAEVRSRMAALPFDAEAWLVVAEAECRGGETDACLATAERVLATSPDNVRALAWKGVAETDRAVRGPAADRAAGLAAARRTIARAIQLDGQAPLPLIAWFQSFTKAGERVPKQAMLGMAKVVQTVPAAPGPRLYLGEELVRQGDADLARKILYPVLHGADDSPEKRAAVTLLAPAGGARNGN